MMQIKSYHRANFKFRELRMYGMYIRSQKLDSVKIWKFLIE